MKRETRRALISLRAIADRKRTGAGASQRVRLVPSWLSTALTSVVVAAIVSPAIQIMRENMQKPVMIVSEGLICDSPLPAMSHISKRAAFGEAGPVDWVRISLANAGEKPDMLVCIWAGKMDCVELGREAEFEPLAYWVKSWYWIPGQANPAPALSPLKPISILLIKPNECGELYIPRALYDHTGYQLQFARSRWRDVRVISH